MKTMRTIRVLALLSVLGVGLAWPALAQQGRQRRVFSNEDVARPAPSPPAPEPAAKAAATEPAAEKAPAGEATPAEAPTPDAAAAQELPPAAPLGPKQRLQRLTEIRDAFQKAIEEFSARAGSESDVTRRMRWENLNLCLSGVIQANQQLISELQDQIQQQAPAPVPSSPGSAQSPSPSPQ